jgi:hypothetical protein
MHYVSAMNRMDHIVPAQREARLRYLDHEFEVVSPGEFVRCAKSGDPIRLDALRYWNVEKQEPFKSAEISFADFLKTPV